MSMDSEIKRKWVEALRSGKYQQGRMYLRTVDNKYCCLGVLADVLGLEWHPEPTVTNYPLDCSNQDCWLPETVQNDIHLDRWQSIRLAEMNDNRKSFAEIADYIEEHL